jgi:DNA-3-methyladenine glycosylase
VAGLKEMAANRGLVANGIAPKKLARDLTAGPSRLCQALGLTKLSHNGLDLTNPASALQVRDDGCTVPEVLITARIGIHVAMDWPLRFALPAHHCVSGPKSLTGDRVPLR